MSVQGPIRSEWPALYKDRNAAMALKERSLWAGQEAVIRCVVPLGKGRPFPARQALRLTTSWPAEWAISCDAVH